MSSYTTVSIRPEIKEKLEYIGKQWGGTPTASVISRLAEKELLGIDPDSDPTVRIEADFVRGTITSHTRSGREITVPMGERGFELITSYGFYEGGWKSAQ